jgi:hypothetical protein
MKKIVLLVALIVPLLVSQSSFAQWQPRSGSTYDWRTGNSYNWNRNFDGSTNVNGFNTGTGSTWNTTIQPNGDMRGTDSRGNLWNYNSGTGTYLNTDGTICTGRGYAQVCN